MFTVSKKILSLFPPCSLLLNMSSELFTHWLPFSILTMIPANSL